MSQKENNQSNNEQDNQKKKVSRAGEEDISDTGSIGNDASATRGGTTDMDVENQISTGVTRSERGAGISTKRNVTGSDFDGQPSQ